MFDNHEKPKEAEDTRTPEEIEQANAELQGGLSEMYSADRLNSNGRTGIDERKVFDALDDKNLAQEVGTSEARTEIAQVYDEMMTSGSPEAATMYTQERNITTQAESTVDGDIDKEATAARVGAEVLNNVADGSADENNRAVLGSEDMTKVTRATTAANLMERLEENGDDGLESFTAPTKSRLGKFMQMVRNRGGAEKTSNKDLEDAGRYIEQNPDVQEEIVEAQDEQASRLDSHELAGAWVRGDELAVKRGSKEISEGTRANIEAYIAASQHYPDYDKAEVTAGVMEMIEADLGKESAEHKAA